MPSFTNASRMGRVQIGVAWMRVVKCSEVERGKARMPRKRQPLELWRITRERIWKRDGCKCIRCSTLLPLNGCHIDHIKSGKHGSNADSNLRTLCRRCHVLRADNRHRGMIASALRDGIIPPNWRELVWE